MPDPTTSTPTTTSTDAIELRQVFQNEELTFVPTAEQMIRESSEAKKWSCVAYDANTDQTKTWDFSLQSLVPNTLIRIGENNASYKRFVKKPSAWYSSKESAPETTTTALFVRGYKLNEDGSSYRLIIEHTVSGNAQFVTRPTYDAATGARLAADAVVDSAVMAYSVCEAKK